MAVRLKGASPTSRAVRTAKEMLCPSRFTVSTAGGALVTLPAMFATTTSKLPALFVVRLPSARLAPVAPPRGTPFFRH